MEREAFRQRMQQYKQARENNPQLKYWDWKKYADGGTIDEDPPQSTSERPITNFDPKGDPYNPTKQNILKYLKSLPDTDSIKKAALQFKNLDDYIKWLNTMPLADNGNINEIENYNFA